MTLLSECLDDRQRKLVAAACAEYVEFFVKEFNDPKVWWYKVHNYNGVNGGAAGCLALALADCTEAYNRNNNDLAGAVVQHARRHAFFVYPQDGAPAYAVIMDDIRKDERPHEFTWQMMFSEDMVVTLGDGRAVFEPVEASGSAYVETPPNLLSGGSRRPAGPGVCALDFEVSDPGQYGLWARVRTVAKNRAMADSFYVRMDNGEPVARHTSSKSAWTWEKVSSGIDRAPVTYEFGAGKHRLALRMREPGTQVDCLLLTRDGEAVPSFPGTRGELSLLEAEAGQLAAPMRLVQSPEPKARLVVRIHANSNVKLATDAFRPADYHDPAAFPRFRATTRSVNPRFIAVLLPLSAEVREPGVTFRSEAGKQTVRIEWPGRTDTLVWSEDDGSAMPEASFLVKSPPR